MTWQELALESLHLIYNSSHRLFEDFSKFCVCLQILTFLKSSLPEEIKLFESIYDKLTQNAAIVNFNY